MIEQYLNDAVSKKASDVFIVPGMPVSFKVNGQIVNADSKSLKKEDTDAMIQDIYRLAANRSMEHLQITGDDDLSFAIQGLARFRTSIMRQRGSLAAVIRVVNFNIPSSDSLRIPQEVIRLSEFKKGLILVTGAAGSGKSTTLACIIDKINHTRNAHIITLEDPIEYLHRHDKSVVTQREIGLDTESYVTGLRSSLRQAPDVILLGEMRDYETIRTAVTAAETGHLVISTLHTTGAANSIDRIVDVFPPDGQHQIRIQLAMVLQAVVSQQLIPAVDGSMVPAFEIMFLNDAIRTMIREGKIHQVDNVIASSVSEGMISINAYLMKLMRDEVISRDACISFSTDPEQMKLRLVRGHMY